MTATGLRRTGRRHYRFRHAAHMEWIKLRSLRSTIWTLVITTAGTIGIGVLILASYTPAHFASMTAAQKAAFDPTNMGFIGTIAGMLALGVLGVLTMTSEYSTGMIRATLTAIPNRPLLLAAKTVVFGAVALAAGQAAAFGNFLAGQAALTPAAPHASLGQPQVLRTVVLTGTFLALVGLLGLGLGAIIRHTAAAVATFAGITFVVPVMLIFAGAGPNTHGFGRYLLIFIAGNSVGAVKPVTCPGAGQPCPHFLSAWAGIGVTCLYAAIALATGAWLLTRRDA